MITSTTLNIEHRRTAQRGDDSSWTTFNAACNRGGLVLLTLGDQQATIPSTDFEALRQRQEQDRMKGGYERPRMIVIPLDQLTLLP
jgi:hypothetical protein